MVPAMTRTKDVNSKRSQHPVFSLTKEERIELLADIMIDTILRDLDDPDKQRASQIWRSAKGRRSNPLEVFKKMEVQAKARGMSAGEFLRTEHPEMADIMRRMVKLELAHKHKNPEDCDRCKLLDVSG